MGTFEELLALGKVYRDTTGSMCEFRIFMDGSGRFAHSFSEEAKFHFHSLEDALPKMKDLVSNLSVPNYVVHALTRLRNSGLTRGLFNRERSIGVLEAIGGFEKAVSWLKANTDRYDEARDRAYELG